MKRFLNTHNTLLMVVALATSIFATAISANATLISITD